MQFLQFTEPPLIVQTAEALGLFVSTIMKTRPIRRLTLGVSSINHTLIPEGSGLGVVQVLGQLSGQMVLEGGSTEERQTTHITY